MSKTCEYVLRSGASLLLFTTLAFASMALIPSKAWAQRGASGPPEHRAVVVLREIEELSYDEYVKRTGDGENLVPVLHANLLHGER